MSSLVLAFASLVFLLGAALVLLALSRFLAGGESQRQRLMTYAALPNPDRQGDRQRSRIERLRIRFNTLLSGAGSRNLELQLMQANWRLTTMEFLLIRLSVTVACFLLGWASSQLLLPGFGLGTIAYLVPGLMLRRKIGRRQIGFEKQLIDVLVLITGAVRVGFSLLQAIEVVVREIKPPASEEFRRVLREVGLGVAVPQALRNLAARMGNDDLDLAVTAIEIQYQVGGNLATMLTAVTATIRERVQLFGEVRVQTAQQRYTGYLLSLLPFFIGGILFIMNPSYIGKLFEPGPMLCVPFGALAGIVLGHIVIRRIARIEV